MVSLCLYVVGALLTPTETRTNHINSGPHQGFNIVYRIPCICEQRCIVHKVSQPTVGSGAAHLHMRVRRLEMFPPIQNADRVEGSGNSQVLQLLYELRSPCTFIRGRVHLFMRPKIREREYSNKLTEIGPDIINEILMQMECWRIDARDGAGGLIRCEHVRNAYWFRIEGTSRHSG